MEDDSAQLERLAQLRRNLALSELRGYVGRQGMSATAIEQHGSREEAALNIIRSLMKTYDLDLGDVEAVIYETPDNTGEKCSYLDALRVLRDEIELE